MRKLACAFLIAFFIPTITFAKSYVRQQIVFGNVFAKIEIETDYSKRWAFKAIQKGFNRIHDLGDVFSTYKAGTEIHKINAIPKPVSGYEVSSDMLRVLKLAKYFSIKTQGYFDPAFETPGAAISDLKIHDRSIDILNPSIKLNPTGLVKGYAVDEVLKIFKHNKKIKAATVALGGDIGHFNREGGDQVIALFDPKNDYPLPITPQRVKIQNQAVSTSGFYERGRHIVNTKNSTSEYLQVSVVADDGVVSDALSTAMIFMPIPKIKEVMKNFPGTSVYLVKKNGKRVSIR